MEALEVKLPEEPEGDAPRKWELYLEASIWGSEENIPPNIKHKILYG